MSVPEKLKDGRDCLNQAGNNQFMLGSALLAIHGALEDHCRNSLDSPQIRQQHGIDVKDKNKVSWQNLLELMARYCGWSAQDVRYVREMNNLRNKPAHGKRYEGTHQQVEEYLSYVENKIEKGSKVSTNSSPETSNSSRSQHSPDRYLTNNIYFPNNISKGGRVTPFRYCIERTNQGVKIYNRRGKKIIFTPANYYFGCFLGCLQAIGIYFALATVVILLSVIPIPIPLTTVEKVGSIIFWIAIGKIFKNTLSHGTTVLITPKCVYIDKKSYPTPAGGTFRYTPQNTGNLYKFYFIQPNNVVYFAYNLTWHEADELLRIIVNSNHMIGDLRSQFTVKLKDGLIFISSCKSKMSFVIEHNDKLWQSLRCRMLKNDLVELTKSELRELYNKKLQEFHV